MPRRLACRRHRLGRVVPAAVVGVEGEGERLRGKAGAAQPHERRAESIARAFGRLGPEHRLAQLEKDKPVSGTRWLSLRPAGTSRGSPQR